MVVFSGMVISWVWLKSPWITCVVMVYVSCGMSVAVAVVVIVNGMPGIFCGGAVSFVKLRSG